MINQFKSLEWHDAQLLHIQIDREVDDIIKIWVIWPSDTETKTCIEFFDCWGFQADMYFGISLPEYILDTECKIDTPGLSKLKVIWTKSGFDMSEIHEFYFNTNSTNSDIRIYAKGFRIL